MVILAEPLLTNHLSKAIHFGLSAGRFLKKSLTVFIANNFSFYTIKEFVTEKITDLFIGFVFYQMVSICDFINIGLRT